MVKKSISRLIGLSNSSKSGNSSRKRSRGQITLFIIVAIVLVAGISMLFVLRGKKETSPSTGEIELSNVKNELIRCVEENIKQEAIPRLAEQGTFLDPPPSITLDWTPDPYANNPEYYNIGYICYTSEFDHGCFIQREAKTGMEQDLSYYVKKKFIQCFDLIKQGQDFTLTREEEPQTNVNLTAGKIKVSIKCKVTAEKQKTRLSWNDFSFDLASNLAEYAEIINLIAQKESTINQLTNQWDWLHDDQLRGLGLNTRFYVKYYCTNPGKAPEVYNISIQAANPSWMLIAIRSWIKEEE